VRTAAELRAQRGEDPRAQTEALLAKVGLVDLADQRADAISTGPARLVELARALACRPRVLLLDEPASGLDDHESAAFAATLAGLAAEGLAILIVEHDVPLVMELCTTITVLNFGEVLAEGTPEEIQRNRDVIDAYLGQDPGAPG
jgi:branched-chain amino acid transport system ATP-binding protein